MGGVAPSSRRSYVRSRARMSIKDVGMTNNGDEDEESDDEAGFGETGDSSPDQGQSPPVLSNTEARPTYPR
ncbi:uncharacterized protein PG998_006092 [Apiospora kogelbergensis]|uniref:uncharacterized protein n=1 Tax=Apiospora kogelbergensis TaxID=1337665 RepID=UPI00312DA7DA